MACASRVFLSLPRKFCSTSFIRSNVISKYTRNLVSTSNKNSCTNHIHTDSTEVINNSEILNQKSDADEAGTWTHFGNETVREEEKQGKVNTVFENVAASYDLMNDVMSAGTHRLWKNHFVKQLNVKPGMTIVDVAGGTGDISFKILDSIAKSSPNPQNAIRSTDVTVYDINQAMLDVGQRRAEKLGLGDVLTWQAGNAEDLPFDDESVDVYTIAFGIRNTTHIENVLDEAYRVLKPGGRFSCLEFSNVDNAVIGGLYDMYSFEVIPVFGHLLASDWKSYQYLVESIRQFPKQEEFADMIYEAGFCNVMIENLTFGVCAIHDGYKL